MTHDKDEPKKPVCEPKTPRAVKQVILVRHDIEMSPGKMAAQVAHAAVKAVLSVPTYLEANEGVRMLESWDRHGITKVVLRVDNVAQLLKYTSLALERDIPNSYIVDAGRTELPPNTPTCGAIGPYWEDVIDEITKRLRLF